MKLGIYDPYFHILGGAERYVLSIALCFPRDEVILYATEKSLLTQAEKKFNLRLPQVTTRPWISNRSERNAELKSLDVFFHVTDGSLFFSAAAKNILIIQSPAHIPQPSLVNYIKLISWQTLICYSQFVGNYVQKKLHKKPRVLFVPIATPDKTLKKKDNLILSVGRFFSNLHNKKQLEMVTFFKDIYTKAGTDIRLILVGSIDPGGEKYFEMVKKASTGLPIELITNAAYDKLITYYQRAKVYWHGAGFGEDINRYPERAEHFGVSTIEAMSYGAVPVVFAAGGQTEIVTNGSNGFTWRIPRELATRTQ